MPANTLILGTANLGLGDGGREAAFNLLDTYLERGGTTIDTAAIS